MKFVIEINQQMLIDTGISMRAAFVLDAIVFASKRDYAKRKDNFFECDRAFVSKLLPVLCDKADGLIPRSTWIKCLRELTTAELIELHPDNPKSRATFIAVGARLEHLNVQTESRQDVGETVPTAAGVSEENALQEQLSDYDYEREETTEMFTQRPQECSRSDHNSSHVVTTGVVTIKNLEYRTRTRTRIKKEKAPRVRAAYGLEEVREQIASLDDASLLQYYDATRDIWALWLDYRRSMRKAYKSEKTFALAVRSAYKQSPHADDLRRAVDTSIASGWQGLFVKCSNKGLVQSGNSAAAPATSSQQNNNGRVSADRAISSYNELSKEQLMLKQDPSKVRQIINELIAV